MTDKLDIVGIGNAMVDAIIPSNKGEVEKNDLNRDSMNLIDEDLKTKREIIPTIGTYNVVINATLEI